MSRSGSFSIIGPPLAAPPPEGELQAALKSLAAKSWRHPLADKEIGFGVSTLEHWYYAAKSASDLVAALKNRLRDDVGRFPSIAPRVIGVLAAQYREHPGWTMQLQVDNLRVALAGSDTAVPSCPTLRRDCPTTAELAAAFRIEVARRQRRSDGTVSLAGVRFEVPAAYRHLVQVHLRYARWDLSRVDLVAARIGQILGPLRPQDKSANADGQRRALQPAASRVADAVPTPPSGMAPLLLN